MPPVPDPSIANDFPDLEAGLFALKQGDYKTAIAKLEAVPLPPEHPLTAKAQMGLAVAYARIGDALRAAALCQTLRQSENPQVSEWATRTLASLAARHPSIESLHTDATAATSPGSLAEADLTGFTPFDPAAPPDFTVDRSGFTLDPAPLHEQRVELPSVSDGSKLADAVSPVNRSTPVTENTAAFQEELVLEGMTTRIARKAKSGAESSGKTRSHPPVIDNKAVQSIVSNDQPLYQAVWRQAGRLKQGKSLGKVKLWRLLLLQVGTAIALFWMVQAIAYNTTLYYSIALTKIPFLRLIARTIQSACCPHSRHPGGALCRLSLAAGWVADRGLWAATAVVEQTGNLQPRNSTVAPAVLPSATHSHANAGHVANGCTCGV